MSRPHVRRIVALAAVASVSAAVPLSAQAAAPFDAVFAAGLACQFELGVNVTANPHRVVKEFKDANGNVLRTIQAGRGSTLTFTNVDTGAALTLKSRGAVYQQTFNPDGSSTVTSTGHTVVSLFPSDVPAGPSTILYTGRIVYASTATSDFTVLSTAGTTRDICAELA